MTEDIALALQAKLLLERGMPWSVMPLSVAG